MIQAIQRATTATLPKVWQVARGCFSTDDLYSHTSDIFRAAEKMLDACGSLNKSERAAFLKDLGVVRQNALVKMGSESDPNELARWRLTTKTCHYVEAILDIKPPHEE